MDTEHSNPERISRIITGIHRLSAVMGHVSESVVQECCGFGMSQFRVLWVLHTHEEGVQQNTIAKWLNLTEAAVSRQLQLMKDRGLLTVDIDEEDRRSRMVHLTPEGREFTSNGIARLVEAHAPIFAGITEDQQDQILEIIDTLFYRTAKGLHGHGK